MGNVFNNASVAAFLGAVFSMFSALVVVAVSGWLSDRRMVRTIRAEIVVAREQARGKLETARRKLAAMRQGNQVHPGEVLKFDVAVIRELKARVLHLLKPRQRLALDGVLFRMEGVDGIFDDARRQEKALRALSGSSANYDDHVARLEKTLDDAIVNLRMLDEMTEHYASGRFEAITTKGYRREDYEDGSTPST